MKRWFAVLLLFLSGTAGCPDDPTAGVSCPPLFELDAEGHCQGVAPESCPGGSMRLLGETGCVPVGQACGADFLPEEDGWGCRPILPESPCTGLTRERLGHASCQPVAPCDPLIPGEATHFVDPALPPDATHFQTIGAALAAAPAGAVVYVAAGTYRENLVIDRAVTLLGHCPEDTILEAPAGNPGMGIRFSGGRGSLVSHFTLRGYLPAVGAMGGSEASVQTSLIEDSIAYGAIAIDPNTRLNLSQVLIRGTRAGAGEVTGNAVAVNAGGRLEVTDSTLAGSVGVAAYVSGTGTLQIDDSVILRTSLDAGLQNDAGVKAHAGGTAWIGSSAVVGNAGIGAVASDPGTTLTVLDSVISDTLSDDTGLSGFGLAALAGAALSVDGLTSTRNRSMSVVVRRSTATLTSLTVRETLPSDQAWTTLSGDAIRPGVGVWLAKGAEVQGSDTAILGGHGEGLHLDESRASFERLHVADVLNDPLSQRVSADLAIMIRSALTVDGLELRSRNHWGVHVTDAGSALFGRRMILESAADRTGVLTGGVAVARAATAELEGLWIDDYPQLGLFAIVDAQVRLEDSVLANLRRGGPENTYGDGVACALNSIVHLRGSEIRGCAHSGLWMEGCGGSLIESRVVENTLGLRATEGVVVETTATLPATIDVGTLIIDEATVFADNQVQVSAEAAPLPETPPGGDPPPQ